MSLEKDFFDHIVFKRDFFLIFNDAPKGLQQFHFALKNNIFCNFMEFGLYG